MSNSTVAAFKPPYLDKFLFILQVLGVCHIKSATNVIHVKNPTKTSKKLKRMALLAYNTVILCSNIVMLACNFAAIVTLNVGKDFLMMVYITNDFMMYLLSTTAMIIMFILSRKSKLYSIRKPKNWISLPIQFEYKMPRHRLICYSVTVILILSPLLLDVIFLATDSQGLIYRSCFLDGSTSYFSGNDTLNLT